MSLTTIVPARSWPSQAARSRRPKQELEIEALRRSHTRLADHIRAPGARVGHGRSRCWSTGATRPPASPRKPRAARVSEPGAGLRAGPGKCSRTSPWRNTPWRTCTRRCRTGAYLGAQGLLAGPAAADADGFDGFCNCVHLARPGLGACMRLDPAAQRQRENLMAKYKRKLHRTVAPQPRNAPPSSRAASLMTSAPDKARSRPSCPPPTGGTREARLLSERGGKGLAKGRQKTIDRHIIKERQGLGPIRPGTTVERRCRCHDPCRRAGAASWGQGLQQQPPQERRPRQRRRGRHARRQGHAGQGENSTA